MGGERGINNGEKRDVELLERKGQEGSRPQSSGAKWKISKGGVDDGSRGFFFVRMRRIEEGEWE